MSKIFTPLVRAGNKTRIFEELYLHFPYQKIKTFVEPFSGTLSVPFNLMQRNTQIKHYLCNDLDKEVFNLWQVVKNQSNEFIKEFDSYPTHQLVFEHFKKMQITENTCEVLRAVRFLYLSNFSYLGGGQTFRIGRENTKEVTQKKIKDILNFLDKIVFGCSDYQKFIESITDRSQRETLTTFCYCDVPYQGTKQYKGKKFGLNDLENLINLLIRRGWLFAISEFDSDSVLDLAKKYNLEVSVLCERANIKNFRNEILITNYTPFIKI